MAGAQGPRCRTAVHPLELTLRGDLDLLQHCERRTERLPDVLVGGTVSEACRDVVPLCSAWPLSAKSSLFALHFTEALWEEAPRTSSGIALKTLERRSAPPSVITDGRPVALAGKILPRRGVVRLRPNVGP